MLPPPAPLTWATAWYALARLLGTLSSDVLRQIETEYLDGDGNGAREFDGPCLTA